MENFNDWYNKNYKLLILIPISILVFCLIYLGFFYFQTGEFFSKDISLTGGTSITIYENIGVSELRISLSEKLEAVHVREIYDIITQEQKAIVIETRSDSSTSKNILEEILGYELINGENSSFEFTGSSLSQSFYKQLLLAILFAFVLMAIVVFILFRVFVPSAAVVFSIVANSIMTLTVVNLMGMNLSSAGIVAFIMLIGYSVDTDILLTTRVIKRKEGPINQRILEAFKTGITMTLTSLLAVVFALIIVNSFSVILSQILMILAIGLGFDIINTWITNVSILKWYVEKNE